MALREGIYSRAVACLKILLPLVALALLSTMFLLARSSEPILQLPFSEFQSGEDVTGEQVGRPYYSGSTARGEALSMTAVRARPIGGGDILADTVTARLSLLDGGTIDLASGTATVSDNTRALLEDGVEITTSEGYVMTTASFRTALDRIEGESLGPVTGSGPAGRLDAGKLQIRSTGEEGDVHLLFTGGVKLIYHPRH